MEVLVAFLCARQQLNISWELLSLENRCCSEGWFTLNYWQSSGKPGEKGRVSRAQKIWPKSRDKRFECCEGKQRKKLQKHEQCEVSDPGLVLSNCPQSERSLMYKDSASVIRTQGNWNLFPGRKNTIWSVGKKCLRLVQISYIWI